MKIPLTRNEVTPEWLKEVMEESLKDGPVQVIQLDLMEQRAGLLSECFKAKIKIQETNRELALFIKIGIGQDDPNCYLLNSYNIEGNEVRAYTEGLPLLVNFEKKHLGYSELEHSLPKVYASGHFREGENRGSCFVMEDLSVDYRMIPNSEGLSLQDLVLVLKTLARFHGLSYCYSSIHKTTWPQQPRYPFSKFFEDQKNIERCKNNFPLVIKDFSELPQARHLVPYVEKLSKNFQQAFVDCIQFDERFLIHGDFWSNNVMFSLERSKVKMLDWQYFSSASPINDFKQMAFTSASPEKTEAWLDRLFDAYFDKLAKTCQEFKVDLPFTKEQFVHDCNSNGIFACVTSHVLFYDILREVGGLPRMI